MNKTKIIAKSIAILVLIFVYKFVMNIVDPIVSPGMTTDLAMLQMQNVEYSSAPLLAYTYIRNYAWVGLVIVVLIVFHKEIFEIINLLKGEEKNEEN